ncbi:MAG: cupin domain-containing protein [Verrucomicrobiae bacterium]|nr:cupin domain-containing protein [Verrucomicrobiae bacterium]
MKPEQLSELAALKAVGALDIREADAAQNLLNQAGAKTRAEAVRLEEAAALMAVAQSPARKPSPSLKGKILARVGAGARPPAQNPFFFVGRNEGEWQTLPVPGVRVKDLSVDARRGTSVKLYELAAGARFPGHHHSGPEECYVLAGDFHVEGRVLHGGDFHHAEGESDHEESFTEHGCTLLVMVTTADYN